MTQSSLRLDGKMTCSLTLLTLLVATSLLGLSSWFQFTISIPPLIIIILTAATFLAYGDIPL